MNNLFNINIGSKEYGFRYGCEYDYDRKAYNVTNIKYLGGFSNNKYTPVQFYSENAVTLSNGVYVKLSQSDFNKSVKENSTSLLTKSETSNITIYFPDFSIEKYENTPCYVFKASTFINGCEVILTQRLINRVTDSIASLKEVSLFNDKFFEQVGFTIENPYNMAYNNTWSYFRLNECIWYSTTQLPLNTNDGSILYVEMIPVLKSGDNYVINEKYQGGSNTIKLSSNSDNYLHPVLSVNNGHIICGIKWDTLIHSTLSGYIYKKYYKILGTNNSIVYNFNVTSKDGYLQLINSGIVTKQPSSMTQNEKLPFNYPISWNDFSDGMFVFCKISLYDNQNKLILQMEADPLPITKDVWSILVSEKANLNINTLINNQQLDYYMNYDIINKIENTVIEVAKPDNYDSHKILPVFIRTKDSQNLEIFTQVTENVTLNLDAYKSSVNSFILKIEDIEFPETARSQYGITFKVTGNVLPQIALSGNYYILNENRELVTIGKYTYKQ